MPSRVALVTGGSRGIGRAIAQRLARDGFAVGVNYRGDADAAKETLESIHSRGGEAIAAQGDVRDPDAIEAAFDEVESALGPVQILVNNAGTRADGLSLSLDDEEWRRVVDVNLYGTFACTRRALRTMLRTRWGRIVNISSVAALRASPGQANYAAAKAGVIALTKTIAAEVARKNITVNAVVPGFIDTDLTATLSEERVAALVEATPQRRAGKATDVAAAVSWLCSEEASFVTGSTLVTDGGLTA